MKPWKQICLIAIIALTVLSLLLSACGPIDNSNGNSNKDQIRDKDDDDGNDNNGGGNADRITICHKTGSAKNPYVEITVSADATANGHGTHEGDLIPAPEGGCPSSQIATEVPAQ
jgi:hypothetical protein